MATLCCKHLSWVFFLPFDLWRASDANLQLELPGLLGFLCFGTAWCWDEESFPSIVTFFSEPADRSCLSPSPLELGLEGTLLKVLIWTSAAFLSLFVHGHCGWLASEQLWGPTNTTRRPAVYTATNAAKGLCVFCSLLSPKQPLVKSRGKMLHKEKPDRFVHGFLLGIQELCPRHLP